MNKKNYYRELFRVNVLKNILEIWKIKKVIKSWFFCVGSRKCFLVKGYLEGYSKFYDWEMFEKYIEFYLGKIFVFL